MKITLAAIAATAALLTGCTASGETMQKADKPEAPTAPAEPTAEPEPVTETVTEAAPEPEPEEPILGEEDAGALLVDLMRAEYPAMFLGVPDADVIDLAHGTCDMFDMGMTFFDVVTMGVDSGYTHAQIGGFIGGSVAAFCPEHDGVIP